jgi:hypothetical protein
MDIGGRIPPLREFQDINSRRIENVPNHFPSKSGILNLVPLAINPIAINGPWQLGWALDLHTLSTTVIGDDAFGHPQFESKRSEIGELLYQFMTFTKTRSNR